MKDYQLFLNAILENIKLKDAFHFKKVNRNVHFLDHAYPEDFNNLQELIYNYFKAINISAETIAVDYVKMIHDMRKEGKYFYKYGTYRCKNQSEAYENVYSKAEVMSYYMNALLISQILWKHHFETFMFFKKEMKTVISQKENLRILDVGPGHGFFSFIIKKEFPNYEKLEIVDISETSLSMTQKILGYDGNKINYHHQDIFNYPDTEKYDFIVLGEVIEHLDEPILILKKLFDLLNDDGILWITTPTNSPALDHVYLFNTKNDVIILLEASGLQICSVSSFFSEDVDLDTALKIKATNLVGVFCKNN